MWLILNSWLCEGEKMIEIIISFIIIVIIIIIIISRCSIDIIISKIIIEY